jgi:RNA polymerase sigma-70 factor (ECF subfamily)
MEEGTQNLLNRARQGDADAFLSLFEEARPMVFSVASRVVGPNEAEDVVMDTYIKAWKAIPDFSGRAVPRTWLCRIAHNCAVDYLRRCKPWATSESDSESRAVSPDSLPDPNPQSPLDRMVGDETGARIEAALDTLAPEHRVTLRLRYSDELSYAEIAAATGVSIGTVMSRLFNGRRKLMKLLAAFKGESA